jgi:gas vesicle protein
MTDPRIKAFSCVMSGLGVGIAVAGLLAPCSGATTRKLIQRKARKVKRLFKTTIDKGNRYITRRGTEALDQASEFINQGKEAYRAAMEKMAPAAS